MDQNLVLLVIGVIVLGGLAVFVYLFRQQSADNRALVDSIRDLVPVGTLREVYKDAHEAAAKTTDTKLDDILVQIGGKLADIVTGKDITQSPPVSTETTTVVASSESTVTVTPPDAE